MTSKELSQLYYLNREIERDRQRLESLKSASTSTTSHVSGLPHMKKITDKTALGAEIAYIEQMLQLKISRTLVEYNRLCEYVASVDDSLVRQIMTARHINGMSWQQVAFSIGGGNTEDSVRKAYKRFLQKK